MKFKQNIERDARLVIAGMHGGFEAVCSVAMLMVEFNGGPDKVLAHAKWLKSDKAYLDKVIAKIIAIEKEPA